LDELALVSEKFTGDDIRVAVKEANMMIIRKKIRNKSEQTSDFSDMDVEFHHLKDALKRIKPNPENDIVKQRQWNSSCAKS
jgi:katanin p60 ATPase-containing subunit A1